MRSSFLPALLISIAVSGGSPTPLQAQSNIRAPENFALESYRKARKLLDAGVDAIGGVEALARVNTVTRIMTVKRMDPGQARAAWNGEYEVGKLPVYSQGIMTSALDYAGSRLWIRHRDEPIPGEVDAFTEVVTADNSFTLRWMRAETPFHAPVSAGAARARFSREVRLYPEGLLKAALRQASTLEYSGRSTLDGIGVEIISFVDPQGTRILLSFDAATHLLLRSEAVSDHSVLGDSTLSATFSDYRRAGALVLPYRTVSKRNDRAARDYVLTSIRFDADLAPLDLAPPQSRIAVSEGPDTPALVPRGGGVYEVHGEYNVMFAVFADYVLLVEAPRDEGYARQVFELIRSVEPAKPIKVVATHHHFDHIGGMRYAASAASEIWAASDAKAEIERALASRPTIRPDDYVKAPKPVTVRLIDGRHVFDDGKQRVEIADVGPGDHSSQLLMAYFPGIATMLVADLWDVPAPDTPLTGADAGQVMTRVGELGWKVERMLAMHGAAASTTALERSLVARKSYLASWTKDASPVPPARR